MASSVLHAKTSGLPADEGNSAHVEPTDWYAGHTLSGLSTTATSFPGSPSTSDRIYRTDLNLEYFYDGTRWLTTTLYRGDLSMDQNNGQQSANFTARRLPTVASQDWWIERLVGVTNVLTTNNGSNYWNANLQRYQSDFSTQTQLGTFNTSADTAAVGTRHTATVNSLLTPATYVIVQLEWSKTSSPGNLSSYSAFMEYRIVGT